MPTPHTNQPDSVIDSKSEFEVDRDSIEKTQGGRHKIYVTHEGEPIAVVYGRLEGAGHTLRLAELLASSKALLAALKRLKCASEQDLEDVPGAIEQARQEIDKSEGRK